MIKALIFDFDGLILDTETHEYEVLQEIFEEHGSVFTAYLSGERSSELSCGFPVAFDYLEEQIGKKLNHEELTQLRRERFAKRMESEKARPGVEAYLNAAKVLGLKVGFASSSDYKWVSVPFEANRACLMILKLFKRLMMWKR
nr:HAD family phosphatase [Bacillus subtilis]